MNREGFDPDPLDITLSVVNGCQRLLRSRPGGLFSRIPVIATTALVAPSGKGRRTGPGAGGYLIKPDYIKPYKAVCLKSHTSDGPEGLHKTRNKTWSVW